MNQYLPENLQYSEQALSLINDNCIIDCNAAMTELLGFNIKEKSISLQQQVFSQNYYVELFQRCKNTGYEKFEWQTETNDNIHHYVSIVTPVSLNQENLFLLNTKMSSGNNTGIELCEDLSVENISLKKELEEKEYSLKVALLSAEHMIIASEKAKNSRSDFVAKISHELRTPLHNILSFARLALGKIDKEVENTSGIYFERIVKSGHRLLELVDNLLDLSQFESGKIQLNARIIDLATLLFISKKHLEEETQDKTITLDFSQPDIETLVWADPDKLLQVVRHVLNNAIKYSKENGFIAISINHASLNNSSGVEVPAVRLIIEDNGIGIPETEVNEIFNKFSESSKTESRSGGTGLGLAICYEIISLHHGQIYAESLEQGARFNIVLPTVNPAD